jgi:hypothetical protein
MSSVLKSTEAVVKDPRKAQEIIDSYALEYAEPQFKSSASTWFMALLFEDLTYDEYGFPVALHKRDWPAEERYPPVPVDDALEETAADLEETAWEKQFLEKGSAGFLAFLCDLAPCLGTPLLVLHQCRDGTWSAATTWLVLPETTEVEMLKSTLPKPPQARMQ